MKQTTIKLLTGTLLASSLLSTGCATIFGRSNYSMAINSNPTGASLSITDKKGKEIFKGVTPATVTLKSSAGYFSKAEYQLKFDLENHEQRIVPLTSKLNGWYFGNLLIGGIIGMLIIDPASGAMYKLPKEAIVETLTKKNIAQVPSLNIVDINSLSKEQVNQLQRIN